MPDVPTAAAEGLLHPTTGATHVLSGKMGIRLCLLRGPIEENGNWVVLVLSRKTDIGLCLFCRRKWGFGIVIVFVHVCSVYNVCACAYVCVQMCARVCVCSFIQLKSKVTAGNVKYLPRGGQIC